MEIFIEFKVKFMRKLSEVALEKCSSIITAINEHPFNQELANGSLSSRWRETSDLACKKGS